MIASPHNPRLKELRKLRDRKHRERSGLFVAEGEDLLAEALRHHTYPRTLYYDADLLDGTHPLLQGLPEQSEVIPVRGKALAAASSLGSGARVIGVWPERWAAIDGVWEAAVYLHEVADPGNVGAVVRAAHALVSSIVILSPGTTDPFAPKAVRASMGAIFGQAVARASFEAARASLGDRYDAIALVPRRGKLLRDIDLSSPALFCLGAERLGLPAQISAACDEVAHVPLRSDGAESLNVAMTATLCLYESAVHRYIDCRGPMVSENAQ
jgi:RNA methyltransferase, TrmH family